MKLSLMRMKKAGKRPQTLTTSKGSRRKRKRKTEYHLLVMFSLG
jgi:hypothetical protein